MSSDETRRSSRPAIFGIGVWCDAWRALRRHPGFSTAVVLSLALGIGATTATFSVAHGVLLRPLPYKDADRLYLIRADFGGTEYAPSLSPPEFRELREGSEVFEDMVGIYADIMAITSPDGPARWIDMAWVTRNFFTFFGSTLIDGRDIDVDSAPGHGGPLVISERLWRERGTDVKTLEMEYEERAVIGVVSSDFEVLTSALTPRQRSPEVYEPVYTNWWETDYGLRRKERWLKVIARVKPGLGVDDANRELATFARAWAEQHAGYDDFRMQAVPLHDDLVRDIRPALLYLLAATALVLLITSANVVNLFLVKSAERRREIAVQTALGAGRFQQLGQSLALCTLLAVLGAAGGVVLARWSTVLLLRLYPGDLPRLDEAGLDLPVWVLALATAFGVALLVALAPWWRDRSLDVVAALRDGGRTSAGRSASRPRELLVVSQITLALVLLVGVALAGGHLKRVLAVDLGFEPERLLSLRVWPPDGDAATRMAFFQELRSRVDALPGVVSSSLATRGPLAMRRRGAQDAVYLLNAYATDGAEGDEWGSRVAETVWAQPGYFETVGARLLQGRFPNDADHAAGAPTAVVDERLARTAWPGASPLGRRLRVGPMQVDAGQARDFEVVGVVQRIQSGPVGTGAGQAAQVYLPEDRSRGLRELLVKTSVEPYEVLRPIEAEVYGLGSPREVTQVRSLRETVDENTADRRFALILMSVFAALGVALAGLGIYGTLAYMVTLRRREMGIRMALGSTRSAVLNLVLRRGVVLLAMGLAAGAAISWGAVRALTGRFGEMSFVPSDLIVVAIVLSAVSLFATWLPARRAARVDPAATLRAD